MYVVVKGRIGITDTDNATRRNKELIFKNNAPFRSGISKINNTFINNAEALDIVMPIYNLLEYGDLWNYYRDEVNDDVNENNDDDYRVITARQQQKIFSV